MPSKEPTNWSERDKNVVELALENAQLKAINAAAKKLIDNWELVHSKDADGIRHNWCEILSNLRRSGYDKDFDPTERKCTCGLFDAMKEYQELTE